MESVVILGGGVSGLSCLNALLDNGVDALLIEGGQIGSPKMCGEFLAPEVVSILGKWDIEPIIPITKAEFYCGRQKLSIAFPRAAGAMARCEVELKLAARARKLGGRIKENMPFSNVSPATNSSPYIIELTTREQIRANKVFFATGRFLKQPRQAPKYLGLKLHFKSNISIESLQMYSFAGAYLGIVPISKDEYNCAMLAKYSELPIELHFKELLRTQPKLQEIFKDQDISKLIKGVAPPFGLKKLPDWQGSYWIGDAYATLHPAIGSGFSHSIQSAVLAANSAKADTYKKINLISAKRFLFYARIMNYIFQRPKIFEFIIPILKRAPKISQIILRKIGYMSL